MKPLSSYGRPLAWISALLVVLAADAWFGFKSIAFWRLPAGAPPTLDLPESPLPLRVSADCSLRRSCPTCADCACASDELVVSGGGYCGAKTNPIVQTEQPVVDVGTGTRDARVWRIACLNSPPVNAYALCLPVTALHK